MVNVLQFVLSGLALGAAYALVAQGIYVTYAATRTFNFAQGQVVVVGTFVAATIAVRAGLPYPLALVGAVLACLVIGVLTERIAIARLKSLHTQHEWLVSTAGASFILGNLVIVSWGRDTQPFPSPFGECVIHIGTAGVLPHEIFVFVAALLTVGLLLMVLERTQVGRAFRAVASNREAAELMGIDSKVMAISSYALSAGLAGVAGGLLGPVTLANPNLGVNLLVMGFIAAIVGGIDNPVGILAAGLLVGVAQAGLGYAVSDWRDAALLVLIILFLGLRPHGLFGRTTVEKV